MDLSDQDVYPNNGGQQATNAQLAKLGYEPEFDEMGRMTRSPVAKFTAKITSEGGMDYAGGEINPRQ